MIDAGIVVAVGGGGVSGGVGDGTGWVAGGAVKKKKCEK